MPCFRISYLIVTVLVTSCSNAIQSEKTELPSSGNLQKYTEVTVIDSRSLDGCEFLLVKNNEEKLQPLNLADSLKIDKLKIRILYTKEKGMGICMAGELVRLRDVKK